MHLLTDIKQSCRYRLVFPTLLVFPTWRFSVDIMQDKHVFPIPNHIYLHVYTVNVFLTRATIVIFEWEHCYLLLPRSTVIFYCQGALLFAKDSQ